MDELNISLQQEISELKEKNQKLYNKNKNMKRSSLRLKTIIDKQNEIIRKLKSQVDNNIDCGWDEISELEVENTFHLENF